MTMGLDEQTEVEWKLPAQHDLSKAQESGRALLIKISNALKGVTAADGCLAYALGTFSGTVLVTHALAHAEVDANQLIPIFARSCRELFIAARAFDEEPVLEDVVLETDSRRVILKVLSGSRIFLCLVFDKNRSNLAITRMALDRFGEEFPEDLLAEIQAEVRAFDESIMVGLEMSSGEDFLEIDELYTLEELESDTSYKTLDGLMHQDGTLDGLPYEGDSE